MRSKWITPGLALAWTIAQLALTVFAYAQSPDDGKEFIVFAGREKSSMTAMVEKVASADVVCLGENHDHAMAHRLELAILTALHARRPKMALSLEFFERDVQPVVNEYLQGLITESHFKQSARPWPTYATDYAPLVEFCKANRLDIIAANAPRRYVNIVSRKGRAALAELPLESKKHLARLPYEMDIPAGYDKMLSDLFGSAQHGTGTASPASPAMPNVDRIKEAQGLWDATMADSILKYRRSQRGTLVLQMNGAGHTDHGWGIVDRLRKADSKLKVVVVSIKPDAAFPALPEATYDGVADYLILTPVEPKKEAKQGN
jgi:uncharacterized iron-regulated protein